MVRYKHIIQTIEDYCEKTHLTIRQNRERLDGWSVEEKKTLLKYGVPNYNEKEYDNILNNGNEEEIWEYERQIVDNLTKGRQDNIIKYLTSFNENDYQEDDDVGYPTSNRGKLEARQEQLQEQQGYTEKMISAIREDWTGGYYDNIQDYLLGKTTKQDIIERYGEETGNSIIESSEEIRKFIDESVGLEVDTVLYRGGHWDKGIKVGTVGELPCLNSTSYSKETAKEVGIMGSSRKYMIKIYAPKGTKGVMVNAPSLRNEYGGHEYLLGKGQKYIVTEVDDTKNTVTIKLIND